MNTCSVSLLYWKFAYSEGKYTGCPNYSGGPGTACKIFQGSLELLSKLFRVL